MLSELAHIRSIIDRHPMTSVAEVRALIAVMRDPTANQEARRAARERLVLGNLRLVVRIARLYDGRGVSLEDLISEGQIGLMRCLETFDPDQGTLSTYATWYISARMRLAIRSNGHIRVPSQMFDAVGEFRRAAERLASQLQRQPTQTEVFDTMTLTDNMRQFVSSALACRVESTNVVWHDREAMQTDTVELDDEVRAVFDKLRNMQPRKLDMLRRLHGNEELLAEIAEDYGITRERVRQITDLGLAEARAILRGGNAAEVRRAWNDRRAA